ncbi:MAG: M20/M25/M40 family metallo-hydrolase [Sediminibacterium sp.]|uniref:M20/M25/M40 family metallo-hydrolase n=1 Tax=Sediminibacterium sp. TaxID=1917865 RepID=UPI002ABAAF93|nr:M20/M25/M40 family metallo-hydrolase [Sediminibacterium sp.]MDZ4071150.1 M20/M25/M40 family metallo-hydrolase [Sediminibacterium sp.]
MKTLLLLLALCTQPFLLLSQVTDIEKVRTLRQQKEHAWLQEFMQLLSIPNVASDTYNIQRNASMIMELMRKRNIQDVKLLTPETKNAPPAIYGEIKVPGAVKTIIFYAHYDGQPVDPSKWAKGFQPFVPVLVNGTTADAEKIIPLPSSSNNINEDWRIFARGASDDKGGVMAILWAYEAIVQSGQLPKCNIKFFFEGEEEAGSPHLQEILLKYPTELQSDIWVICDGPVHQSGNKLVCFGVRGDANMDVTVYGPLRPLHSGHYGNWVPNPALMMAKLLASMKDENGKVTIKGFYDDVTPLSPTEKAAIASIPMADEQMKKELGFIKPEMDGYTLQESLMLPSLNINGIQSANAGKLAANVIPTTAIATLDLRLVKGNDYQLQQQRVVDHIKAQGYYVIDRDPTIEERNQYQKIAKVIKHDGYNAQRTPMDLPIAQEIVAAVKKTTNGTLVIVPSLGGSLPLYKFEKFLKANTISVPIANHDNNQHAENENIRIRNLWNGVETMAAIMLMK